MNVHNSHYEAIPNGANGTLPLNLGMAGLWQTIEIVGGPFHKRPPNQTFYGVCLVESEPPHFHVHMPIRDFSVPTGSREEVLGAVKEVLFQSIKGRRVWVGCLGGWGRTGLMLSLVAKAAGVADPIDYVRSVYTPRAVETDEQEQYVRDFDVSGMKWWLFKTVTRHMLGLRHHG